jgi:hypothetical protein
MRPSYLDRKLSARCPVNTTLMISPKWPQRNSHGEHISISFLKKPPVELDRGHILKQTQTEMAFTTRRLKQTWSEHRKDVSMTYLKDAMMSLGHEGILYVLWKPYQSLALT